MTDLAMAVKDVSKVYHLYNKPVDRLKESIHPFRKKYHQEHYALRNVSFELKRGETLGIIGKNGSGKSTLLKIITGVLTPTAGTVEVNGKIAALLELGAGFNMEFTGIENIYMNGTIMGYTKAEMDAKLDEIVAFADIGDYIYQPVKMYSSGMFARLAFAVNSNVNPDILIVDEALSVGDMFFQAKCMARMRVMMEQGTTVLFVSHDSNTIKSFCRKALWLNYGETLMYGDSAEVVSAYEKALTEQVNINNAGNNVLKGAPGLADPDSGAIKGAAEVTFDKSQFVGSDPYDDPQYFRRGIGATRFRSIKVLNPDGSPMNHIAEYNQEILIRTYVEVLEDCENLCVVYRIRNKQGIGIVGNDTSSSLGRQFYDRKWKKGDLIQVDFVARLPLEQGIYNIACVVSTYGDKVHFMDVVFLDWLENTYVFEMRRRSPVPVWQAVYLDNKVGYKVY